MKRKKIYEDIVDSFDTSYGWLGEQFAHNFLLSACSWNIQQYSKPSFRMRRHLLLYWKPGWLKCQRFDQKVLTKRGYITLKQLESGEKIITVKNGKRIETKAYKSGSIQKPTIKIITKQGYQIVAGFEHPFRVIDENGEISWKKAEALVNTDIMVMAKPEIENEFESNSIVNPETARLIGYLIGDGCYAKSVKNSISFTNSDSEIAADYLKLMKKYISKKKIKVYSREGNKAKQYALFSTEARKKLERIFGLDYVKSREKTIPEQFIVPNKKILENLLFGLYQADGSIRTNGITFASVSVKLLKQIQEILLLLGVESVRNSSHLRGRDIRVYGWNNLERLPLICSKSKHKERIKEILQRRNQATDCIKWGSKIILNAMKYKQISIRKQTENVNRAGLYSKKGKSRTNFKKFCKELGLENLSYLTEDTMFFNEIKEIYKNNHLQECYDLFVPETEQFISQGFLTHNSSLLGKAHSLLGDGLSVLMSDISVAALRGTVDYKAFITPFTLKRPFSISTEFGQVVGGGIGNEGIIQQLLNILEEGETTVSLAKISQLSAEQIVEIEKDSPITFIDNNTFTYKTNWILLAGTYNKKFLVDNAFESRFNIMIPNQKLDASLLKKIHRAPPFSINESAIDGFRYELLNEKNVVEIKRGLPDAIYELDLTARDAAQLISYSACRRWWGFKTSKDDLISIGEKIVNDRNSLWLSTEDKIMMALETDWKTADELAEDIGVSRSMVYRYLKRLGATNEVRDSKVYYKI